MEITVEMIDALATLRLHKENNVDLERAVSALDEAGIFAPIDNAVAYEEAQMVRLMKALRDWD